MNANKGLIREADAARMVDLSLRTLQRLRTDGGGPPFLQLTPRRVAYREDDLKRWLDTRLCNAQPAGRRAK